MIKFEKVSFKQFEKAWKKCFGGLHETTLQKIYDKIKLPARATEMSAGYDFYIPDHLSVTAGDDILIPTGIRFVTDQPDVFLMICPRSGLGFKYGMKLKNTIGIIDADYQNADNEGHIMAKFSSDADFSLKQGEAFCQGIFLRYLTVDDDADNVKEKRKGGFGSTTK